MENKIYIKEEISKHILVVGPDYQAPSGGVAIVIRTLSYFYENFQFLPSISSKNRLKQVLDYTIMLVKLQMKLLSGKIKIVHIHGASYGSFIRKSIIILISKIYNVKVIYHIHGGEYKSFYKKYNYINLVKSTLNKADKILVLSRSWQDFFAEIVPSDKIAILNNIVPNIDVGKSYNIEKKNKISLLFLGKIGNRKGLFDLIDVIITHKQDFLDELTLYIGGDGETHRLINIIEKEKLHQIVKFEGWVSGEKKEQLLKSCDVYILPSYNEGLPISILEAMSYGMPIISTNVGGIPEIVKNRENGFLINPGDRIGMYEAIKYFINDNQAVERMGMVSLETVRDFYPESVIPKLIDIYKSLLK